MHILVGSKKLSWIQETQLDPRNSVGSKKLLVNSYHHVGCLSTLERHFHSWSFPSHEGGWMEDDLIFPDFNGVFK